MKKLWFLYGLCVIFCLAGCASTPAASTNAALTSSQAADAAAEDTAYLLSYDTPYTLELLMEGSTAVVLGTVKDGELLTVNGVDGGTIPIAEYRVEISQVLRGDLQPSDTVLVQRTGNPYAQSGVIFAGEPTLERDVEYLLFLQSRQGLGGSYNTGHMHFFVLGRQQGVFEETPAQAQAGAKGERRFISQQCLYAAEASAQGSSGDNTADTILLSALEADLEAINQEVPAVPTLYRDAFVANLESNLESGFISEEEYYDTMEKIKQYAQVAERVPLWE
ncbi:hypothetical protein [Acutalibacter caecimuris]|uniref:hypothetical protein n=1 Tax=Acutalibacter caecimuris TaxID=3093657 RepID=UPI002AC92D5B|nr:hypothetical protein [Acutalibacter sp. M00118]